MSYSLMRLILVGLLFFSCKKQPAKVDCKENKILFFKGGVFFEEQAIELSIDSQILYQAKFQDGYSNDRIILVNTFCTENDSVSLRFKLALYDTFIPLRLDGIDTVVFQSDYSGRPYVHKGPWPDA